MVILYKTVEPFLDNDRKQANSRNNSPRATIELLSKRGFPLWSVARGYQGGQLEQEYTTVQVTGPSL
jgi:hypothetical protein